MMFFKDSTGDARARAGLHWALPTLLLTLLPLLSWAGGSPGEEITSLPVTMVDDTSGVCFLGGLDEMRALSLTVQGSGRIDVRRLDRHLFAVTFVGDYRIGVDRAALARTNVQVIFQGGTPFEGGTALMTLGRSDPVAFPAERVPLPLSRLASSPRLVGPLLDLDVFGLAAQRAHVGTEFGTSRVTLFQRETL